MTLGRTTARPLARTLIGTLGGGLPWDSGGGAALAAPVNTVAPVVSGTRGGTLSCTTGTWTGTPAPTYTYQWQAGATVGGGGSWANIGGATASTFDDSSTSTITAPYDVRCVVTATNAVSAVAANSNTLAAWTPSELGAKLRLWLDERGQTVTGSGVSAWVNNGSAGATLDFAQGTDANRPPQGTINSLNCPDFDGTADRLDTTGLLSDTVSAAAWEFACVYSPDTLGADVTDANIRTGECIAMTGGAAPISWGISAQTSGIKAFVYDGSYRATAYAAISTGSASIVTGRADSGTLYARVAAGTEVSGTGGTISDLTDVIRLGCNFNASAFADGKLGALLVCNAVLSTAERAVVRLYLGAKYAVTV